MTLRLTEKIDSGGYADVWKGKDDIERDVAVKIIRSDKVDASDAIAHAKALARAEHPNVVKFYNVDTVTDPSTGASCYCVVMELLLGDTLETLLLKDERISIDDTRRIVNGMIAGLEHIHERGLVHGDFHEANVIIAPENVKIIDILYRDTLASLSSTSRASRIQRDMRNLKRLID